MRRGRYQKLSVYRSNDILGIVETRKFMKKALLFAFIIGVETLLHADHLLHHQKDMVFEKVSSSPEVYICNHFLSNEECNHIIRLALPTLSRSTVVDASSKEGKIDSRRTSKGTFLSRKSNDRTLKKIQKQAALVTGIPVKNGEDIQVLHYSIGGEYQPHFDFFSPSSKGEKFHLDRGGQRVATLIIYLNTVEEGGETIFPKIKTKIKPEKGKALLFYNVDDSGKVNSHSFHGGLPVIAGEKWIATLWLREKEFF